MIHSEELFLLTCDFRCVGVSSVLVLYSVPAGFCF